MTNNEQAITNIETMANNVMSFRSYYHTDKDVYAEVDDAAQEAENALRKLAEKMRYYDPDAHDVMTHFNAHNPDLVRAINDAWKIPTMRDNFGIVLAAIIERDCDDVGDRLEHFPESFDETLVMAGDILEKVCDDEDLKTILSFVGYTRK